MIMQNANAFPLRGAGLRWTPLPQAEEPTEPTGETGGPLAVDEVEKCGRRNEECGIKGRFATDYNNMQSAMCIVQLAALRGLYYVPYIESYIRIALLHSRSSRRGDYQSPPSAARPILFQTFAARQMLLKKRAVRPAPAWPNPCASQTTP